MNFFGAKFRNFNNSNLLNKIFLFNQNGGNRKKENDNNNNGFETGTCEYSLRIT